MSIFTSKQCISIFGCAGNLNRVLGEIRIQWLPPGRIYANYKFTFLSKITRYEERYGYKPIDVNICGNGLCVYITGEEGKYELVLGARFHDYLFKHEF